MGNELTCYLLQWRLQLFDTSTQYEHKTLLVQVRTPMLNVVKALHMVSLRLVLIYISA